MFSAALYARVRFYSCHLHARPRVQRASGIPCSLIRGRTTGNLGQIVPREYGRVSMVEMRRSPGALLDWCRSRVPVHTYPGSRYDRWMAEMDNIVFEHLRHIRGALDDVRDDSREIKQRVGNLENQYATMSNRLDRMDVRI